MAKKRGPGRRYTAAEKQRILDAACSEGLTGAQVRERFGVSTLSFYRWRGPVRVRRLASRESAPMTLPALSEQVRAHVRAEGRLTLLRVVQEEVRAYLALALGSPSRRRVR